MPTPLLLRIKFACFVVFLLQNPFQSIGQQLMFEEQADGWMLLEDGQPRYFYQTATKSKDGMYPRANYIHPLYNTDGEVITEDFPADHPHHRGIFWTWHQLWVNEQRAADPWICENIVWEVKKVKTAVNPNGSASLEATIIWKGTGAIKKNLIEEKLSVTYQRVSSSAYKLAFDIELKPLMKGIRLGGSEDPKGYGGFSPRIRLGDTPGFYDEDGKVMSQELPIAAGPWINLTAAGPNDPGTVIMGEPDELPAYQGWILRAKNSMQNLAFPGKEPILLDAKNPLRFRNQLLVHRGIGRQEIIDQYRIFRNQ